MDLARVLAELKMPLDLKPPQKEALKSFYDKKDTFVCLPTGFGKSLIYQLTPFLAAMRDGEQSLTQTEMITLVVTPLNSIMKDQVMSLAKKNIPACYVDMSMTSGESYRLQHGEGESNLIDIVSLSHYLSGFVFSLF